MIADRFKGYEVLKIEQHPETGIVWVRARRADAPTNETIVTADVFFIAPIARQIIRLFPAPSNAAQSTRLQNELAGSLRLIEGGKK